MSEPQQEAIVPATAMPGTPEALSTAMATGAPTFVDHSRHVVNLTTQPGAVLVLSVASAAMVTVDGTATP